MLVAAHEMRQRRARVGDGASDDVPWHLLGGLVAENNLSKDAAYHVVPIEQLPLADAGRVFNPSVLPSCARLCISVFKRSRGIAIEGSRCTNQRLVEMLRCHQLSCVPCLLSLLVVHLSAGVHVHDRGESHTEDDAAYADQGNRDRLVHRQIIAARPA